MNLIMTINICIINAKRIVIKQSLEYYQRDENGFWLIWSNVKSFNS